MRRRTLRDWRDASGVAMVTVLLVGAGLTVLGSAAAFTTIQEFRSGTDDRRALAALSYAEAGVDRMVTHLKSGLVTYNDMNRAGCADPPLALPDGVVGQGEYSVELTVYDPEAVDPADRFPIAPTDGACASRPINPHVGQGNNPEQSFFVITAEGRHPAATRTVRQVIAVEPVGLPIGIYATNIDINSANHPFQTVSMVSRTNITHRGSIAFLGEDPYYLIEDFFPSVSVLNLDDPVPAAAHAAGTIYLKHARDPEFEADTKNCDANNDSGGTGGVRSQSLWDSDGSSGSGAIASGCTGQTGWPSTSKFEQEQLENFATPELSAQDHQLLKEAAQRFGVYCSFQGAGGSGGTSCTKQGTPLAAGLDDYDTYIEEVTATTNSFVAYFEYRAGAATSNNLSEIFTVWGCDPDPDINRSVLVIVRNGGINWTGAGGEDINGAIIIDGDFNATGNFTFNGTIIVKGQLNINSSAQEFGLDECWVRNMPGPFLRAVPTQWSEIDR